jgi:toxin ParE1/3/4
VLSDEALDDLMSIYRWIAEDAGLRVADRYYEKIRSYCRTFDIASERGTRHDNLLQGLRIVGFEKSITLAFKVYDDRVLFLRVFYGGRDWEAAFRPDSEA